MPVWRSVVWLSFLWVGLTWAQIYKWTDHQGIAHFTDNPSRIPAEYRSKLEVERPISSTPPVAPSGDDTEAAQTDLPAPGAPPSTTPPRDRLGRGPNYWRTLAQQWSTQLQQFLQERDRLQLLYQYTRQLANTTRDVWDRGNLEAEATRLGKAIAGVEAQIKEAEVMLQTTLPLEAIQQGADPDWLKPAAVTQQ